jgi:hypothetical protein
MYFHKHPWQTISLSESDYILCFEQGRHLVQIRLLIRIRLMPLQYPVHHLYLLHLDYIQVLDYFHQL